MLTTSTVQIPFPKDRLLIFFNIQNPKIPLVSWPKHFLMDISHGYFYLSDVGFDDQYPPLAASCIEMELELIRRSFFPEKLSHFQSFFAFESLNSLSAWMPFFKSYNCRLWEIEFFHAHYEKHDAGLIPHFHSDDRPYSPSLTFQCGYEYWSGKFSKNPIYELLIKPPVLIKQEIHLPTQIP